MKKPKLKSKTETLFYVEKKSVALWKLVELTIEEGAIAGKKTLHEDIPAIVLGKYVSKLRNEKIND